MIINKKMISDLACRQTGFGSCLSADKLRLLPVGRQVSDYSDYSKITVPKSSACRLTISRQCNWIFIAFLLFTMSFGATAQKQDKKQKVQKPPTETPQHDTSQDEKKVRDLVEFLEFMLNTLGSSSTPNRDKEVVIHESYSKIFRDSKVQIEDDLDEDRKVITNKDVVAYLKDVDFFFHDVKFEFIVESIKQGVNASGNLFYKVSLRRNITGTTAEGMTINNRIPRHIEINYNPDTQDLKIASIYTNEINEKEALTLWWRELSYEWQSIFKRKLNLRDSLSIGDIRNITFIRELDLSDNQYIQTLEPLAQLHHLRSLNISSTRADDLTPIRNLAELSELDLSHTRVDDLSPLKYSTNLISLDISDTEVRDIDVVQKMPRLEYLYMSNTQVADFTPLSNLSRLLYLNLEGTKITNLSPIENLGQLAELNISGTSVNDLGPLMNFKNLKTLSIDSTSISDTKALGSLVNLEILHANHTFISDLQPLQNLAHLEKIYCDQTPVKREAAYAFMSANPSVLVVFDSKDLKVWWESLSRTWQNAFSKAAGVGLTTDVSKPNGVAEWTPTKEELAKVTNLDSINLADNVYIFDLEPLRNLLKLQTIVARKTHIRDLESLREHRQIKYLDISETGLSDISVVSQFTKLKIFKADKTKIEHIDPLYGIVGLEKVYADETEVNDIAVQEFLEKNSNCLVVYKTSKLNRWWKDLSPSWKKVFREQMDNDTLSSRENLHKLTQEEALHFKDEPVEDLTALSEFVRLKELHFSGTSITGIPPLENIRGIKSLHATNSPMQRIESLRHFSQLENLDLSNTPLYDLKPLGSLRKIKKLNCSGTPIRKLDALKKLETLESLDCSNTSVKSLKPVSRLSLKTLKCFNTKISRGKVKKFKKRNPDCNVVYYR